MTAADIIARHSHGDPMDVATGRGNCYCGAELTGWDHWGTHVVASLTAEGYVVARVPTAALLAGCDVSGIAHNSQEDE